MKSPKTVSSYSKRLKEDKAGRYVYRNQLYTGNVRDRHGGIEIIKNGVSHNAYGPANKTKLYSRYDLDGKWIASRNERN